MRLIGASADEAGYQLLFRIPGIRPALANSLKQIRQRLNLLIYPRRRPHFQQRRTIRVENFGLRADLAICP